MPDLFSIILIILGLALFEIVISIDNAVINAEVLGTMSKKARKWFLFWGILIAVFLVRGLLPWVILWVSNPSLGFLGSFTASFSSDPNIAKVIEESAPILLIGGGTFLVFLFFHWIFLETKHYGLIGEETIHKHYGVWFFAVVSILLSVIVWSAIKKQPWMAFGAVVGSTAFFITHGFKENAEKMEREMLEGTKMKDISKIFYLEVIDATFSIDGILGAFAFTFILPIILIGNGIGALVVRQLTLMNIENVKKYKYLKNGAMYSIFALGSVMILDSFGLHIPEFVSPVLTFAIIGYFFWKSVREIKVSKVIG